MLDIQSATAENRRGKKEERKKKKPQLKIYLAAIIIVITRKTSLEVAPTTLLAFSADHVMEVGCLT